MQIDENNPVRLSELDTGRLYSGLIIDAGKSIKINIRMWLDENTPNTEIGHKYSSKLESAKEKDSIFIESIFGGSLNEKNECTLKEATKDLEILINFIPKIESFYNKSLILSESMNNNNDLVNSSIELVCESVSNYAYNVIKNVMVI